MDRSNHGDPRARYGTSNCDSETSNAPMNVSRVIFGYANPPPPPPMYYNYQSNCWMVYQPQWMPIRNSYRFPPRASNNNVAPRHYQMDPVCHPLRRPFTNVQEAYKRLCVPYGGYYSNEPVLLNDGTYKMANGKTTQIHYHCWCRTNIGSSLVKCPFRPQLRKQEGGVFVFTQPKLVHNHTILQRPKEPMDQQGLHPTLGRLLMVYLDIPGRSVLCVTCIEVILFLYRRMKENQFASTRYLLEDHDFLEHSKVQITNWIGRKRDQFVKNKLNGNQSVNTYDALSQIIGHCELQIPATYVPGIYDSLEQLAQALQVDSTGRMFAYDLMVGQVYKEFKKKYIKPTPA
jgi:hypothetical protein